MDHMLMGGMAKALVDELSIDTEDHAHNARWKKELWCCRIFLSFLDNLKVDVVKDFFLIVLTTKFYPWESRKVYDERVSW